MEKIQDKIAIKKNPKKILSNKKNFWIGKDFLETQKIFLILEKFFWKKFLFSGKFFPVEKNLFTKLFLILFAIHSSFLRFCKKFLTNFHKNKNHKIKNKISFQTKKIFTNSGKNFQKKVTKNAWNGIKITKIIKIQNAILSKESNLFFFILFFSIFKIFKKFFKLNLKYFLNLIQNIRISNRIIFHSFNFKISFFISQLL